ncbi:MAG: hypothetical protein DPW09_26820 [Anaerolineae bacterium]|nr:SDR family NAD(P)-dependent oxidoreductase [Anaerolineales bacterium]MCQ3977058.1 hypothetical protein [Anaerolineae bacterium]
MDKSILTGRRAMVTGAGRGIGQTIALALAQAGADVAVTARSQVELEAAAAQIRGLGRRSLVVAADVTDPAQVEHLAAAVQADCVLRLA